MPGFDALATLPLADDAIPAEDSTVLVSTASSGGAVRFDSATSGAARLSTATGGDTRIESFVTSKTRSS